MPGPNPSLPDPKLHQAKLRVLDGLAFASVFIRLAGERAGMSEEKMNAAVEKSYAALLEAAGIRLPKARKGRPASLDSTLRRAEIIIRVARGQTVSSAVLELSEREFVVLDPDGKSVHKSPPLEGFRSNYHRDRRNHAEEDALIAFFAEALRRHEAELAPQVDRLSIIDGR